MFITILDLVVIKLSERRFDLGKEQIYVGRARKEKGLIKFQMGSLGKEGCAGVD